MKLLSKGFTLIELIVTIAIIAVLSGIILFSVTQYINKGKDSNIFGNLAILVPAGEVFYNSNGNSYNNINNTPPTNFCDPQINSVIKNTISQMPKNSTSSTNCGSTSTDPTAWTSTSNLAGVCCYAVSQAWVAYATEFANPSNIYCVDSRGMKEDTPSDNISTINSTFQCYP